MPSESIRRQDASGHMPLAVCHNGRVVALVRPFADHVTDGGRAGLIAATATGTGIAPEELEILAVCHLHPQSSAVDCLDCEPINE